jgi:hypothetical protein
MARYSHRHRAGRLLCLSAWLAIALVCFIAIMGTIAAVTEGANRSLLGWFAFVVFPLLVATLQYYVGRSIIRGQPWSRKVGIVWSILLLFGFPIGTALGAYVLYALIGHWDDPAPSST